MRSFLIFLTFAFFLPSSAGFAAEADLMIDTDLVKILDSFDSKRSANPHDVPRLMDIVPAKGTLVFFDNSKSSGKKPTLGKLIKTQQSDAMEKTLDKARQRLAEMEEEQEDNDKEENKGPVFSDRSRTPQQQQAAPRQRRRNAPRFLSVNYSGEKVLALIPPDTFVEVPFLKHIPYFFTRIEVLDNSAVKVTETIERVVEKKEKDFFGIDRHFPKYHSDRTGKKHRTNLTVLETLLDKTPVESKLTPELDGVKLSLRSKKPLAAGTHVYEITYLLSNKIAEFNNSSEDAQSPDFKELIWSVTGSHWDIPITRAGAVIIFPPESTLYSQSAITSGPDGYGENYRIKKDKGNDLSFVITYPLAPYEDMTILANWSEKNPSTGFQNGILDRFLIEHGTFTVTFLAFLFILSYYIATWVSLRKNQAKSSLKTAPAQKGELSAAVLNYALTKEITPKALFITLLDMASKKFLAFDEQSDGTLILIKLTDKASGLTPLEKKIAGKLFIKENTSFALTSGNLLRLKRIMADVEKDLTKEYRKKFTTFPQTYFCFGILMAVIAVIAVSAMSLFPMITAVTSLVCAAVLIPTATAFAKMYTKLRGVSFKENKKLYFKYALFALLLSVVPAALFVYYSIQTTLLSAVFFFALTICIGVFKILLRSPSVLGKSILENMDGYKIYLSSQDDTLLSVMRNAEQKIRSLYNKHLPFAVAMDMEQLWTRRFVTFSEKENQLKPDWYKGTKNFTDTFVSQLYEEFAKAFPQEKTVNKNARSPRVQKRS